MNTRIKYQAYFDQFVTNGFYPKIVQPCRFTKKTGSVIDHTFHLDNGKLPIGVFLDLSKAFDTLDHTISLDKLLYYGIKGTELAWFKSYLTNRTQFVSYNGTNSRTLSITTGVPQGSILGPLLFMINMNDIHNASSKIHAILFADDTNLTSTLCPFDVNIDNDCNSLQLSTNINKELKKHTNMVRNKQTVT